jgi:hydroxyacylglutathione hydrolase
LSETTSSKIQTITCRGVNCYLIKTNNEFILVDSGFSNQRSKIENTLDSAGVQLGNLRLILLTHGDFDHAGNCAYFRDKYQSKIAMHEEDQGMVEHGNLFSGREGRNVIVRTLAKLILPIFRMNLKKQDHFTPDIYLKDGDDLSEYGFSAKVIHIPGHSKGSIAFLTTEGRGLFIGDLLENHKKRGPVKGPLIDDSLEFSASIDKLKALPINTVYPGHGEPFPMIDFTSKED